jgi:pyrroloquinoline quinone biosynthesis protein D
VAVTSDTVPVIWRLARLDFDRVRQQPILQYPEGVVLLNDTGAAILELCDGQRTVGVIAGILRERYQVDVLSDVIDYLSDLAAKELISAA